jgi:hypothetical protein
MLWFVGLYVGALLIPMVDEDVAAWEWGAWACIVTAVFAFALGMAWVFA